MTNKQKINKLLEEIGMQKKDVMYDEIELLESKDFKRLCFEIKYSDACDIYVLVNKSRRKVPYIIELSKVDNEQDINFLTVNEYLEYATQEDLESRIEDRKNFK